MHHFADLLVLSWQYQGLLGALSPAADNLYIQSRESYVNSLSGEMCTITPRDRLNNNRPRDSVQNYPSFVSAYALECFHFSQSIVR